MKRRILSLVLCFCMALSLLPMGALADEGDITIYFVNNSNIAAMGTGDKGTEFLSGENNRLYYIDESENTTYITRVVNPGSAFNKSKNLPGIKAKEGIANFAYWSLQDGTKVTNTDVVPDIMREGDNNLYAVWSYTYALSNNTTCVASIVDTTDAETNYLDAGNAKEGDTITLTATEGMVFETVTVSDSEGQQISSVTPTISGNTATFTMPAQNVTVSATATSESEEEAVADVETAVNNALTDQEDDYTYTGVFILQDAAAADGIVIDYYLQGVRLTSPANREALIDLGHFLNELNAQEISTIHYTATAEGGKYAGVDADFTWKADDTGSIFKWMNKKLRLTNVLAEDIKGDALPASITLKADNVPVTINFHVQDAVTDVSKSLEIDGQVYYPAVIVTPITGEDLASVPAQMKMSEGCTALAAADVDIYYNNAKQSDVTLTEPITFSLPVDNLADQKVCQVAYSHNNELKFVDAENVDITENGATVTNTEFSTYAVATPPAAQYVVFDANYAGGPVEKELKNTGGTYKPAKIQVGLGDKQWEREGFTLLGWDLNPEAKTATYPAYPATSNIAIPALIEAAPDQALTGTITLYAVWEEIANYTVEVTANPANGGTAALPEDAATVYAKGETVTVNVAPTKGYVAAVTYTAEGAEEPVEVQSNIKTASNVTFTMPEANVTVNVTFTPISYVIEIDSAIEHGTVKTNPAGAAATDSTVQVTATPDPGYELEAITAHKDSGTPVTVNSDNTFVMIASKVIVSASFKLVDYTVTLNQEPLAENAKITVAPPETAKMGDLVTLTVVPNKGWALDTKDTEGVVVADTDGVTISNLNVTTTTISFAMPASNVTITPKLAASAYMVTNGTIASSVEGGKVLTINDKPNEKMTIRQGNTVTVVAEPAEGYQLKAITATTSEGAVTVDTDLTANTGTFIMPTAGVTVSAEFEPIAYTVTYNLDGGQLPEGTADPGSYTVREAFTLPTPTKDGYTFAGWLETAKDGAQLAGATATNPMTIPSGSTGNRYFTATWTVNTVYVGLQLDGKGSIAAPDLAREDYYKPGQVAGNQVYTSAYNAQFELPTPVAKDGYTFDGWTDEDGNKVESPVTITAKEGSVFFKAAWLTNSAVTVVAATNGEYTFDVSPDSLTTDGTYVYAEGTPVSVVVRPSAGYDVKGVTAKYGDDISVGEFNPDNNTFTFTMPASAVTVSPEVVGRPYKVTVVKGISHGSVTTSATDGIAAYLSGVTITATPDTGYEVDVITVTDATGKSVDVSGTQFQMPNSDVTVNVTFKATEAKTYDVEVTPETASVAYGVAASLGAEIKATAEEMAQDNTSVLSYQWYKNGNKITGATLDTYATDGTDSVGEYVYKCVVTFQNTVSKMVAEVESNEAIVTVTPASIKPVVSIEGWTYGDTPNEPSVTEESNPGGATPTFEYKEKGQSDTKYKTAVPTDVGEYIVRATVPASDNYAEGVGYKGFTIEPKDISLCDVVLSKDSYVYDGVKDENKKPVPTVTDGSSKLTAGKDYTVKYFNEDGRERTMPYLVGTYTVEITGIGNYTNKTTATYVITAAPMKVTAEDVSAVYDGEQHDIDVQVSNVKTPEITYSKTPNGTYSSTQPEMINAGSYTVFYKVTAEGYQDGSGAVTVTIAKKPVEISWAPLTFDYLPNTEQKPTATVDTGVAGENLDVDVQVTDSANQEATPINAGNYVITATALKATEANNADPANYTLKDVESANANFVINKADPAASVTALTLPYNGEEQTLVSTGDLPGSCTVIFKDGSKWTSDLPTGTDAGEYPIVYKISGDDNYNNVNAETPITANITPLDLATAEDGVVIISGNENATYDGTDLKPTLTVQYKLSEDKTLDLTEGEDKDFTVTWAVKDGDGNPVTELINAGTYVATITGRGNYENSTSVEFTIEKRDINEATVAPDPIPAATYTGEKIYQSVTVTFNDIPLSSSTDYKVSTLNNLDAGTATMKIIARDDGNFFGTKLVDFEILKADSEVTKAPTSRAPMTYNGDTRYLINNDGVCTGGDLVYFLDNGEEGAKDDPENYSTAIPIATAAGDYTVWYMVKGDSNHNDTEPASVVVTISPRQLTDSMVSNVEDQTYAAQQIKPDVEVKDTIKGREVTLTAFDEESQTGDYQVSYGENVNAGDEAGKITVTGNGNYTGTVEKTFKINPYDILSADKKVTMDGQDLATAPIPSTTYNGEAQEPDLAALTFTKGDNTTQEMVKGQDYTISYTKYKAPGSDTAVAFDGEKPVNAGTYTIEITGIGNFTNSKTRTFTINKAPNAATVIPAENLIYNGEDQALINAEQSEATWGDILYSLDENGTFAKDIPTGKDAGTYTVYYKVLATDNYHGVSTQIVQATIKPMSLDDVTVIIGDQSSGSSEENSEPNNPPQTNGLLTMNAVRLVQVLELDGNGSEGNEGNAGEGTEGNTGNTSSNVNVVIPDGVEFVYDGTEKKPPVKVIYTTAAGKEIEVPVDQYGVTYQNNIEAGENTAIVKASTEGATATHVNYVFDIQANFTIKKANSTITTAPAPKIGMIANGTAQQLVSPGVAVGGEMQYSLDGKNYSTAIPTGTAATTYTIYYKVVGDANHNDIEPATITASIGSGGSGRTPAGGGGGGGGTTTYTITVNDTANGSTKSSAKSAARNATVTITPTPAATYMVGSVSVVDKSNKAVDVEAASNGTYTFKMPASNVTVTTTFVKDPSADPNNDPSQGQDTIRNYSKDFEKCDDTHYENCPINQYPDASATAWYHDGVHFCIENGIMRGYDDGHFYPAKETTRAQLVQVLYNIAGQPNVTSDKSYSDVNAGDWFYKAVQWATKNDIVSGYNDGKFRPNDPITREQVARVLMGYAKFLGYDTSATSDLKGYTDTNTVSNWATEYVQWAVGAGVYCGPMGSTTLLAANGDTVRSELATMMMNFCTKLAK